MKIVNIQELIVGDVFAKEIKLHGRQAYEVIKVPKDKDHLIALQRGEINTIRINFKTHPKVYFLRSMKDLIKIQPTLF